MTEVVTGAKAEEEQVRERADVAESEAQAEAMEDAAFAEAEAVRRAAKRQEEEAITEAAEVVAMADEIEAAAAQRAAERLTSSHSRWPG
jgi:hypothetical protein